MKKKLINIFILLALSLVTGSALAAGPWNRLVDLRGTWKFEIGDNLAWAKADFDDSGWEDIFVPASWEDEGFPGYDGFAWYRKHFQLSLSDRNGTLYLFLGRIDDVDEVYLNGRLIGFSGVFPPKTETAYQKERQYLIPPEYLNPSGENVVAVRVYDERLIGGILEGKVGIFELVSELALEIPLDGIWKFSLGDNPEWSEKNYDDRTWRNIIVPSYWEVQGYRDYDGYAWYRKEFVLPEKYAGQALVLILGNIDDLDETYLNGKLIGKTGRMSSFTGPIIHGDEWQKVRTYELPAEDLLFGQKNVIAVRVFDGLLDGGIYAGAIGIIPRDRLADWQRSQKKGKTIWDYFDAWLKNY